jgi:heme/copper-type cytochrome/quinol oxidase subunit 2
MSNFSKMLLRIITLLSIFITTIASAQPAETAQALHDNGKIYVVVAILSVVFLGIIFFLIRIERRLKNLEKNQD